MGSKRNFTLEVTQYIRNTTENQEEISISVAALSFSP